MRFRSIGVRQIAILVVLLAAITLALTTLAGGETVRSSICGKVAAGGGPTSTLKVVGTQMQDSGGKPFIPYGISVVSGPETTNWTLSEKAVQAQIVASHQYWHANSVRIQVSQSLLFKNPTRGHSYNVPFADSVNRLVCKALRQGQVVIINDNSIFTGAEKGPTALTQRFWAFMAQRYGNDLPVIFDLYNEPQVVRGGNGRYLTPQKAWDIWRDGGRVGAKRYVGMQQLVDEIRSAQHANNVIWVEQPYYYVLARTRLDLLETHLLHGSDIVYAFHKLPMEPGSPSKKAVRVLADRGVPLVTSEWTQFAASDRPWMCQPTAYETVPGYLDYLRSFKIGLIAWSLQPGVLVRGVAGKDTVHDGNDYRYTHNPRDLAQPTEIQPDYGCKASARGQGAGKLVMDYFARYSEHAPTTLFPSFR